jgi:DNA-binding MarR family transcriptional regulator
VRKQGSEAPLSSQVLSPQAQAAVDAWVRLMGAHGALSRAFNAELQASAAMTTTDFDVLRRLAAAEDGRMRRVDLAGLVGLTPSGITRLLEGLQACGLVCKESCPSEARVTYAAITDEGRARLARAAAIHLASLEALFGERYTAAELDSLVALLARLPGAEDLVGGCPTPE